MCNTTRRMIHRTPSIESNSCIWLHLNDYFERFNAKYHPIISILIIVLLDIATRANLILYVSRKRRHKSSKDNSGKSKSTSSFVLCQRERLESIPFQHVAGEDFDT